MRSEVQGMKQRLRQSGTTFSFRGRTIQPLYKCCQPRLRRAVKSFTEVKTANPVVKTPRSTLIALALCFLAAGIVRGQVVSVSGTVPISQPPPVYSSDT